MVVNGGSSEAAQSQAILDVLLHHELQHEPQHHELSTEHGAGHKRQASKLERLLKAGPRTAEVMQAQVGAPGWPQAGRFFLCFLLPFSVF